MRGARDCFGEGWVMDQRRVFVVDNRDISEKKFWGCFFVASTRLCSSDGCG